MADKVNVAPGQCRLQRDSSSQISLQRFGGAYLPLKIAGVWSAKLIPSSGPTLSNSGLTAATKYYIYAFDSSGTLALEASATAHAVDTDTGIEIKSGDATRTLVGMVYMGAGSPGTFVNTSTQRFLRNWFNREKAATEGTFTADRSTSSGTFVELHSEIRVELLNWSDENVRVNHSGVVIASSSTWYTRIGMDSGPTFIVGGVSETVAGSNHHMTCSGNGYYSKPSEGYHFFSLYGRTDAGVSHTWRGASAEVACSLRAWVESD